MTVKAETMLQYLQSMLDYWMAEKERFGMDDRMVQHTLTKMLACKDMVEALIGVQVNLQQDGKVTTGF